MNTSTYFQFGQEQRSPLWCYDVQNIFGGGLNLAPMKRNFVNNLWNEITLFSFSWSVFVKASRIVDSPLVASYPSHTLFVHSTQGTLRNSHLHI